jgi:hypothetical protein
MEYTFYKISCLDKNITDSYIGLTSNFTRRKREHKRACYDDIKLANNTKLYQFIRENGGWKNWEMVSIDKQIFETRTDAHIYETKLMEEKQATLNKNKTHLFVLTEEHRERKQKFNELHYNIKKARQFKLENQDELNELNELLN